MVLAQTIGDAKTRRATVASPGASESPFDLEKALDDLKGFEEG